MPKYIVRFKIEGTGWCEVDAESAALAETIASMGPHITPPTVDDWEINPDTHRDGYIAAQEAE